MTIKFILNEIMKERNLEQKDIIAMTGISRNTIKMLVLDGNNRIDYPTLDKLCLTLGVTPGDLIKYVE